MAQVMQGYKVMWWRTGIPGGAQLAVFCSWEGSQGSLMLHKRLILVGCGFWAKRDGSQYYQQCFSQLIKNAMSVGGYRPQGKK